MKKILFLSLLLINKLLFSQTILYQNSFDTPISAPLLSVCAPDFSQTNINSVWQGSGYNLCGNSIFNQKWTVETVLINGSSNIYTDPTLQGGDYCIGMLSTIQDDKLALTINSLNFPALKLTFDLSAIGVDGCGVPSNLSVPSMEVRLYDSPNATFSFTNTGTLLDIDTMVGISPGLTNYTFNWDTKVALLNSQNSTSNYITIVFDLISSPYAAIDNIKIEGVYDGLILNNDTTICSVAQIPLNTISNIDSNSIFWWTPNSMLNDSNSANPIATINSTTTYHLNLIHENCNLVSNNDFENGNINFSSQYIYSPINNTVGEYGVATNPQNWNNILANIVDHTSGNGNMLLVNGSANSNIWCNNINVLPNTNYVFSAWVHNLNPTFSNSPILQLSLNGVAISTPFNFNPNNNTWQRIYKTWNSGILSNINICINNLNFTQGNFFALDDISFAPYLMEIDSIKITKQIPPIINLGSPISPVCFGSPVTLTASGASTYSWTGGVTNGVSFTPNVTNTYTVTGTDANGCTATSSVAIQVSNNLPINVTNTSPILCLNDVSTLTATGANSYSWLPSAGLNTTNTATVLASPTSSTTYTVVGTDANGCTGSVATLVDVVQPINIVVSKSNDIECGKSSAQLLATGATNYFWTPSNLVSNPNSNITSTSIKKTTTFYVTGTKGSCTDTDSITVEFFNSDGGNTFIPTAFSPNGDNKNDCLNIKSSANFSVFYFAIYNRWGQRVFESDNVNSCWNGIYNGKEAIADTYYYYLKAKTSCGDMLKKGDITLVR